MLQIIKKIYRGLPAWVTAPVRYIPDGLLFGKSFRQCTPRVDTVCLNENLKKTLDYAREHTVWGRDNIPERIAQSDVEKVVEDLPCVDANELHAEPERFVSCDVTEYNSYWTTTGETGKKPTSVCLSNKSYGYEWRHILDIWGLGGYSRRNDLKLTLRGYHFKTGEILRHDPIYNEIGVDSFQLSELSESDFCMLADKLNRMRITCIHGYPTLIDIFKERLLRNGMNFRVRELLLASEGASVIRKKNFSEFFGARILSWYGLTEKVVLAYDEFADNRFKVYTSYGFPRIVNPDSQGIGEIVGTTFVNFAMPLVNYKTGDYGRIVRNDMGLFIENLSGRSGKDFVYENESKKYPITAINLPGYVQDKIVFYQVIQERFADIKILVLLRESYATDLVVKEMLAEVKSRLPNFHVTIMLVNDENCFERSKRGKFRMLVQRLGIPSHDTVHNI